MVQTVKRTISRWPISIIFLLALVAVACRSAPIDINQAPGIVTVAASTPGPTNSVTPDASEKFVTEIPATVAAETPTLTDTTVTEISKAIATSVTPTPAPAFQLPQNLEPLGPDNVASLQVIAELPVSKTIQLAFSPIADDLAVGTGDGTVQIWDLYSGYLLMTTGGHGEDRQVHHLSFSADGTLLLSGITDIGVKEPASIVWDSTTGQVVHSHSQSPSALSPNGRFLAAVTGLGNSSAEILDLATGAIVNTLAEPNNLYLLHLAYSPDGQMLIGMAGGVDLAATTIWRVENDDIVASLEEATNLSFSPSGDQMAVASADSPLMSIYDTNTWRIISEVTGKAGQKFSSIGYSPDGRILAGALGNQIMLYDTANWNEAATLPVKNIDGIAFSPNGKIIATHPFKGTVSLWGVVSDGSTGDSVSDFGLVDEQHLVDLAWAALDQHTSSHDQSNWQVVDVHLVSGRELASLFAVEQIWACPGQAPPADEVFDPLGQYGFVHMRPWPATPDSIDPSLSPTAPPNVPEPFINQALFLVDLDRLQVISRKISCLIY